MNGLPLLAGRLGLMSLPHWMPHLLMGRLI